MQLGLVKILLSYNILLQYYNILGYIVRYQHNGMFAKTVFPLLCQNSHAAPRARSLSASVVANQNDSIPSQSASTSSMPSVDGMMMSAACCACAFLRGLRVSWLSVRFLSGLDLDGIVIGPSVIYELHYKVAHFIGSPSNK